MSEFTRKAAFSIKKYQFSKVSINLENYKTNDISLLFEPRGIFSIDTSIFELSFILKAFNNEDENNPFLELKCEGIFDFEEKTSFENIPDYFYTNSIAILYPYVRAYVSIITAQASVPMIILPTYNLSSLGSELKKQTTQK